MSSKTRRFRASLPTWEYVEGYARHEAANADEDEAIALERAAVKVGSAVKLLRRRGGSLAIDFDADEVCALAYWLPDPDVVAAPPDERHDPNYHAPRGYQGFYYKLCAVSFAMRDE